MDWRRPHPRLPSLLTSRSSDLRSSDEWKQLQERWHCTPALTRLQLPAEELTSADLSKLLRAPVRRPAYEYRTVVRLRGHLRLLDLCSAQLNGLGSFFTFPSFPSCPTFTNVDLTLPLRLVMISKFGLRNKRVDLPAICPLPFRRCDEYAKPCHDKLGLV